MKRVFCDICSGEILPNSVPKYLRNDTTEVRLSHRGEAASTLLHVRVFVAEANPPNGSHLDICTNCRLRALDSLDPRPREAQP